MVLKIFDSTLFSGIFFNNFHVAILSALQLKTFFCIRFLVLLFSFMLLAVFFFIINISKNFPTQNISAA